MMDYLLVGLIVAVALAFSVYRLMQRNCGCGCDSSGCSFNKTTKTVNSPCGCAGAIQVAPDKEKKTCCGCSK